MASTKDLDLVLFGATGFTGQLLAEQIARQAGALRWGLAGRSEAKLRGLRDTLSRIDPRCATLPLLSADAGDEPALGEVAKRTRVIATTVGPYLLHGLPLTAACAAHGTDYCDLSGEVPFIRASIDRNQAAAQNSGARLLHACGFDSIPSDLGVLALHDFLKSKNQQLREARFFLKKAKGGFSGGTLASMFNLMAQAKADRDFRRLLANPYALLPEETQTHGRQIEPRSVRFDREAKEWTAPFVMGAVNTRVVHRSNALLGYPYGRDFRYSEYVGFGTGLRGAAQATAMLSVLAGALLFAANDTTRGLLARMLPQSGQGPSPEQIRDGRWRVILRGFVEGSEGAAAILRLSGEGDPGYGSTARMLAEVALLLVETHDDKRPGGVFTPASAFGMTLIQRLSRAGLRFELTAT